MHIIKKHNLARGVTFQDLSAGEKDYIRRIGVTEHEFDRMDPLSREQWVEETQQNHYEKELKKSL